ncbi:zinc finger protein 736 [Mycetomoellerius zeteki]|uniref:zinc finger protein 736 n=1 Tax=Mycetomoellerius zeteki TaxID=64791 RepID=UPI00084E4339|nr:PREDICTED: zinc finger protein 736-like [Trachymyrmex zeteki]
MDKLIKGLLAQMLMSQDNNEWSQRRASGSSYKMSRGIRKKSIGDAKYECGRCGKTYKATTSLSRHKRLECGVVPCEMVNKFELNASRMNAFLHLNNVNCGQMEPLPKQYLYGECGKMYKWMDNLRRHQRLECDNKDELSNWLIEPFVKQELHEGGYFEFVTVSNQLSSEHENEQCTAEKSNDEEPEICEVAFHGQLKYLLCDSPILNNVEANVVQKNSKSCQQFRCDGCGRTYTRVDSLKRHQQKCDELLASFQDRQEALERLQQQL